MLSRDCDGCSQLRICSKRFKNVSKGEKVYCSDGTLHLVDDAAVNECVELSEQQIVLI
jgi:hypothetical protein